jgi:predicted O-methyltransferase YrrM
MIYYRSIEFLKYALLSRHRLGYGIHSPFVFDLVSRVFRNKIDPDIVLNIENIRKQLLSDKRSIYIHDLGSGSGDRNTNLRKVSYIARNSAVPRKYGILLSRMAKEFGKPTIVEFGTSLGISTMYMAASCPEAIVYTIEGCRATSEIANENFRLAGIGNVRVFNGSFDEVLPLIKSTISEPGLVFIDGNHKKGPLIRYCMQMAEISCNSTVVIVDDIYSSFEMAEAWKELKQLKKVTLTLDIFRMGFLFFREGLNNVDYIIRY